MKNNRLLLILGISIFSCIATTAAFGENEVEIKNCTVNIINKTATAIEVHNQIISAGNTYTFKETLANCTSTLQGTTLVAGTGNMTRTFTPDTKTLDITLSGKIPKSEMCNCLLNNGNHGYLILLEDNTHGCWPCSN